MFELLEATRFDFSFTLKTNRPSSPHGDNLNSVRRSEIYSRSSSVERSPIDPNELLLRERLEKTFINQQQDWSSNVQNEPLETAAETIDVHQDDPDVFEFRLFSKKFASKSSPPSEQVSRKIVLRSPTPTNTSSGFMIARRPDAYYFTDVASAQEKEQFESTAVSGEEIMNGLKDTWVCACRVLRMRAKQNLH